MDGWNTILSYWETLFSGVNLLLVSGRVNGVTFSKASFLVSMLHGGPLRENPGPTRKIPLDQPKGAVRGIRRSAKLVGGFNPSEKY